MLVKLAAIFFSMILVNNYVLVKFYGICPFLGVSKKLDSAVGMSGAVIFVMFMATAVTFPLQIFLLDAYNLGYLQTIIFILVIAVLVQLIEITLKKYVPALYQSLGVYLPLITTNCCVLGVAGALAVWAAGLADIEGALALLIIGVVFGVVYGAYAMFWMAETLPRYYDENRICNFAQGAFHIHIPGVYYNNRNWKHILRAFRVWSMASLVLVPPCTAGAVFVERATGWQVWVAVLVVYIASLFGAIVIPAKRFE